MIPYANISGNSGVSEYELGNDFIKVRFGNRDPYVYNHNSAGSIHVNEMKRLAAIGEGLATYISQNCRDRYAKKE